MYNIFLITLALLVVIGNGLIGHFLAPSGIMITPLVLTFTTCLVCLTKNMPIVVISLLTYCCVALNDILLKLYAGGSHDEEGLAWMFLFLLIGLIPTFIILLATAFSHKHERLATKVLALVLFIALIAIHLSIFSQLGLGRKTYWYEWNN